MSHARAAVAGVLAVGLVMLMVFPSETLREPERAFAALIALLAVIALLLGTDIVGAVKGRRDDKEDDE